MKTGLGDVDFGEDFFWQNSVEILRLGGWKLNLLTKEIQWSRVTREIHGVEKDYIPELSEAIGFYSTKEPGRKAIQSAIKHSRETGVPWDLECRFVSAKGQEMWVRTLGHPIRDSEGEVVGLKGIMQDISDYKNALSSAIRYETDLEQQKYALDEHAIVSIGDVLGNILYVNDKFCQISGYSREELLGQNHRIVSSGHQDAAFWTSFWTVIKRGETFRGEICNRAKDGNLYWVDSSVVPHWDNHGNIDRFISIRADVTQRKLAEEQQRSLEKNIRQMQKMEAIGQLVGGIAHDFNNILAVTNGYASLLKLELQSSNAPRLEGYAENIEVAGNRAKALVQKMLAFARGGLEVSGSACVGAAFKEFEDIIRPVIPAMTQVSIETANEDLSVALSSISLSQILMNLCINANDAIIDGGKISISAKLVDCVENSCNSCGKRFSGEYVELLVEDNGAGISADEQKRIFEPFYTTKDVGRGTGMGLSVVHGIVHGAHGHIALKSSEEFGSQFSIYLPRASGAEQDTQTIEKIQSKGEMGRRIRLMLVDDEEAILQMLTQFFLHKGFEVKTSASAREAYQAITEDQEGVDVLITDISMPGESGLDLCKSLKEIRPQLPIIAMTGYNERVTSLSYQSEQFNGFVSKPIALEDLLGQVVKLQKVYSE